MRQQILRATIRSYMAFMWFATVSSSECYTDCIIV